MKIDVNVSVSVRSCINCLVGIQHTSVGLTDECVGEQAEGGVLDV